MWRKKEAVKPPSLWKRLVVLSVFPQNFFSLIDPSESIDVEDVEDLSIHSDYLVGRNELPSNANFSFARLPHELRPTPIELAAH